jgi:citrate lyase gamma subunit
MSFASAIVSVVLAVLAIFYSMISNQGFSETLGSLHSSSRNIEIAASNIQDTSLNLNSQSERLLGEISSIPPKFQALSDKIDAQFHIDDEQQAEIAGQAPEDVMDEFLDRPKTLGTALALYGLAKSRNNETPYKPSEISGLTVPLRSYVAGALQGIRVSRPLGLIISAQDGQYLVESGGQFDFDKLEHQILDNEEEFMKKYRKVIEDYFSPNVAAI